ncbi:hypothetical protein EBB07_28750 [Paenibacillaceae bacterium]|nr:hypothetical protein EBB07_28750 [Paenibacillaceae bacterium]
MDKGKYLQIKNGDRIVLNSELNDGVINLKKLSEGKIVYHQNQVEADIWFYNMKTRYWDNPIRQVLAVKDLRLEGLVFNLKKEYFSVLYQWREHTEIQIDSREVMKIPFFKENDSIEKIPSSWYENNERVINYKLSDIIEIINDEFSQWVSENLKTRKVYKYEKENGEYPEDWDRVYTEGSMKTYWEKRNEIEEAFRKVTKLHNEFLGGVLFE